MKRFTLAAVGLTVLLAACQHTNPSPAPQPIQTGQHPTPAADTGKIVTDELGQPYVSNQLVVALAGQDAQAVASRVGGRLIDQIPQLDVVVIELPQNNAREAARLLTDEGQVQFAEPQRIWQPEPYTKRAAGPEMGALSVNQVFDELPQYALDSEHLNAKPAWDEGYTGKGVLVGVIDDPVDISHPDLRPNWGGKAYDPKKDKAYDTVQGWIDAIDGFDGVVDGKVDDSIEHGTAVASTIAAAKDGKGIVGVAPEVKFLPAAMFQPGSVGTAGVAKALLWLTDNGVHVINNSWGGAGYDPIIKMAMDYALARNVTIVVSAGNESREYYQRPALFAGVIPSAALAVNNDKAGFSTFGRHISVAAPGSDVLMTAPLFINEDGTRKTGVTPPDGSGYTLMSGTSFSGPYTSGVAALILQANPSLDPYQVRRLMEETADGSIGSNPNGFDRGTGYGRIDVGKLTERLKSGNMPEKGGTLRVQVQFKTPTGEATVIPQPSDVILEKDGGPDSPIYGAQTDAKGMANFLAMAPGEYTIRVGGPDLKENGGTERGTYVGKVTIQSGTTLKDAEIVTIILDKGYVAPIVDTTEPNDSIETAAPIAFGERTPTALIYNEKCGASCPSADGDVDFYKFEGQAGKTIVLTIFDKYHPKEPIGNMWGVVYIRDAKGVTLKNSLGDAIKSGYDNTLTVTLPQTGTYYLQVGTYSHLNPTKGEKPYKGTFVNAKTNKYILELQEK